MTQMNAGHGEGFITAGLIPVTSLFHGTGTKVASIQRRELLLGSAGGISAVCQSKIYAGIITAATRFISGCAESPIISIIGTWP